MIGAHVVGLLVFPHLNVWTAAALATILAPTDAPAHQQPEAASLGSGAQLESGLNTGMVPLSSSSSPLAGRAHGAVFLRRSGWGEWGVVAASSVGSPVCGSWAT